MTTRAAIAAVLAGMFAAGCSSGNNPPQCAFTNKASLSTSAWPKFRHDFQNTATINDVDLTAGALQPAWVFPPVGEAPRGPFAASPVLNSDGTLIYIGSNDGALLALNVGDGSLSATLLNLANPIANPALVGVRAGADAIFVGGSDGLLYDVDATGTAQAKYWPYVTNSFITGGPALSNIDGTVYAGTSTGFFAVCPNGIARFGYTFQGLLSPIAVGANGTAYVGSNESQLRAIFPTGKFGWTFSASAPIVAAPVVDDENNTYTADTNGKVFKVSSAGLPDPNFAVVDVGPVRASPALNNGILYVPAIDGEGGQLLAVDSSSGGAPLWTYETAAPILSSPAVAVSPSGIPVIVFGTNDGNLYVVRDDGTIPTTLQVCHVGTPFECTPDIETSSGPPVQSSPAIGADGTVYVGANDGRVYAVRPASGTPSAP